MPRRTAPRYRKTLLALAAGAALVPHAASALDLAQSPPGTVEPYVAPNVIISVDDSGSMDWQLTSSSAGLATITAPKPDGSWDNRAKRLNVLKHALSQVFNDHSLVADKKIRLAWQTMWNNGGSPGAKNVNSTAMNENSMRVLESAHRANFLTFVNKLKPSGGTPSHNMFSQADAYMRQPLGVNSPWASNPGTAGAPYLGCRRNYHIMMTDGRWNGTILPVTSSERDNTTSLILPDGTPYGGTTATEHAKSALYRDTYSTSLADWAFRSWAIPLQDANALDGSLEPDATYRKAPASENFGNDGAGNPAVLERFWNPRYNPATWPHMVTYTIGFSRDAVTWPGAPTIAAPTASVPFGFDGSFPDLVTGRIKWPALSSENVRALDLWHAALNGRGRFYAVEKGEDLEKAFREIFQQINTETEPNLSSTAASGTNISRNDVGRFTAGYDPEKFWMGYLKAEAVKKDGTIEPLAGWNGETTAEKLDALGSIDNRVILSWGARMDAKGNAKGGVPFKWATDESNLSTAQKLWLQKNTAGADQGAAKGEDRLNYIRGDRSLEGSEENGYTAAKPFRERASRQGDIVNSVVWYTGAPVSNYPLKGYTAFTRDQRNRAPMIYVGGNDGMLHGFAAADGSEKIAYVPNGVIPTLTNLTAPEYNNQHRSYVDGSPMTGDVDLGMDPSLNDDDHDYEPDWRTLLVGTLGAGGKGYFVLDVTDPAAMTEGNAQSLVRLDRSRSAVEPAADCVTGLSGAQITACELAAEEDADIGHITAQPVLDETNVMRTTQITRMNNNRWAVVMGNGYNSTNQRPVLLVQYLDGAQELLRIQTTGHATGTGNAADNGLAAPRLMDLNGDGRVDIAYAGDNLGNMWKFDLTSETPANWKVAFGGIDATTGNSKPLFTARGPASLGSALRQKIQPITAPPSVRANDRTMTVGSGTSAKTVRVGGMMVAFGTGRNVATTDAESVDVQTLYSVLDNTRYKTIDGAKGKRLEVHPGGGTCPDGADCVPAPAALGTGVENAKLAQQRITELDGGDFGTVDTVNALNQDTWADHNGWYMDLPAVGERLLKPMEFFDGSNILAVYSQVPAKGSDVDPDIESCESTSVDEERQFRTLINIMDGKDPSVQIVDYSGDGSYDSGPDKRVSRKKVTKGSHTLITKGNRVVDLDVANEQELLARMPEESLRPSWRLMR